MDNMKTFGELSREEKVEILTALFIDGEDFRYVEPRCEAVDLRVTLFRDDFTYFPKPSKPSS